MPELGGYGVLTVLRQDPVTATISFIFLQPADKVDLPATGTLALSDGQFTQTNSLATLPRFAKQEIADAAVHQRTSVLEVLQPKK